MNPDIVYKVCTYLTLNEIRNFSNINKEYDDMCEYYIKNNIIVKIKHRDEAIKLANEGYKIKYEELNKSIKDVSSLGNVHTLDLSFCTKIKDVSSLGNVHTLNLSFCTKIKNVSALGNVHTLNLSFCKDIKDVSALGNVTGTVASKRLHTLFLNGCTGIKENHKELKLMLSNVKKLILP